MNGNLPLAAYLEPGYCGRVQEMFKKRGWLVTDAMKAGLGILLICDPDIADLVVKSQHNEKGPKPPDPSFFGSLSLVEPAVFEDRYDRDKVRSERGPQGRAFEPKLTMDLKNFLIRNKDKQIVVEENRIVAK